MVKSKIAWYLLVVAFVASLVFVRYNYTKANPIVNIKITMDRNTALRQAATAKAEHHWGPDGTRAAAEFESDGRLQTFVELEAGGKEAFSRILKGNLLSPYTWHVRFFREGEVNETSVLFTPAGQFYGFHEKLSENAPGTMLDVDAARSVAEKAARDDWHIDLGAFQPVETSKEVRPGGRVDHIFVYERPKEKVGEGRYRLRLVVSGDRLTELSNFLKIPESFDRRYEQMRSANETIATVDMVFVGILYIGVGCLGGLFFLLRRRYLLWKTALLTAVVVALLGALGEINYLPVSWMEYNTAESARVFLTGLATQVLVNFVTQVFLLGLTFMVAESLTRRAFPHMAQLWKVWRPAVAASPDISGQTFIGFLMIGILLAYDVAIYLFGNKCLGWWAPADTLSDPNILSMYLPWLTPMANALHAGFWEECLFRAVPLSLAALIGVRLGRPRLVVGVALVAQALIFGAAHANYPNQPAYARIIEIAPAFIVFGMVYLRFGLLPVIIAHFGTDMAYMSMPLFFTQTDTIWVDRLMAIMLFALPLIVVLVAAAIRRGWHPIPEGFFNRAWQPPLATVEKPRPVVVAPVEIGTRDLTTHHAVIALTAGILAVVIFASSGKFNSHSLRLEKNRSQATAAARQVLVDRHLMPTGTWTTTTAVWEDRKISEKYVWEKNGPDTYDRLQRMRHLAVPVWHVRMVRFDPSVDVAERAETFGVLLAGTGEVIRVYHELPEARPGVDMTQNEARDQAMAFLAGGLHLNTSALKEISTVPQKRPNRTDWIVTMAYTNMPAFTNHEVMITICLANGGVTDVIRDFHTPEDWVRKEQSRRKCYENINHICGVTGVLLFLTGMIVGFVRWSRGYFARDVFLKVFLAMAFLFGLSCINDWPKEIAGFSTTEPWANQCLLTVVITLMGSLLFATFTAFLAGVAGQAGGGPQSGRRSQDFCVAFGIGLTPAILFVLPMVYFSENYEILLRPSFEGLTSYIPLLAVLLQSAMAVLVLSSLAAFFFTTINRLRGRKGFWLRIFVFLLLGFVLVGNAAEKELSVLKWLAAGLICGLLPVLFNELYRNRIHLVPISVAANVTVTEIAEIRLNGYPGSVPAHVLAIIVALATGWIFSSWLARAQSKSAQTRPAC